MNFEKILLDIDNLLTGKELRSINPSTPSIYISEINHTEKKYYVSQNENQKGNGRSFNELIEIWSELKRKGFTSVDQALYGSGTSRNQPETIFSNLPYIQHFKYKNKKHILLRSHNVHESGTLSEVSGSEFRKLRKLVDNYQNLSLINLFNKQKNAIDSLRVSLDSILKKYPGESVIQNTEALIISFEETSESIQNAIVSLDNNFISESDNDADQEEIRPQDEIDSFEKTIESSAYTGIEDSDYSESDEEEKADLSIISKNGTKIRQLTPVISLIYDRLEFDEIELQPDFQRKDRIWKDDKKVKLIESILMGLPLPAFYFAEKPDGTWIIVDGLQRITSIYDFIKGKYTLGKLRVLGPDYDNKSFKDLSRREQRFIREYAVTAYIIDITTDTSNVVVELFHRINTYGVKLSDQEIRSALNNGSSTLFLRFLSSLNCFKKATHGKVKPERQKDMELCLSALSFMILGYKDFGSETYSNFLTKSLVFMNKYKLVISNKVDLDLGKSTIDSASDDFYLELYERFIKGMRISYELFGEISFLKEAKPKRTLPISKSLFEILVAVLSNLNEVQERKLIDSSSLFVDMFYSAIENDELCYAQWDSSIYSESNRGFMYSVSTSTGKKATINFRFDTLLGIIYKSTGISVKFTSFWDKYNA